MARLIASSAIALSLLSLLDSCPSAQALSPSCPGVLRIDNSIATSSSDDPIVFLSHHADDAVAPAPTLARNNASSRRSFFRRSLCTTVGVGAAVVSASSPAAAQDDRKKKKNGPPPFVPPSQKLAEAQAAAAAQAPPPSSSSEPAPVVPQYGRLETSLYSILRAREAVTQETRLIKSGKFKDAQRANVKLAVRFIVQNYYLNENFITASASLEGGNKRYQAADIGQQCVQSLLTILEYFDSSDVQNIRVATSGLGDKEIIVLKGLEATKSRIDEFLSFFPSDTVDGVKRRIQEENDLNAKEFDPAIGVIINPDPIKV